MKIKKVLPKIKEEVVIPDELQNFLKINIYQAYLNNQQEAVIQSDDGIQNEVACAGLIDVESKIFVVTYYPDKESKYYWSFDISLDDLKEISEGKKNSLTLWKCSDTSCQNKSGTEDSICLLHDFVDDGTGESELVKNIHHLSIKEMLDKAYGFKKNSAK